MPRKRTRPKVLAIGRGTPKESFGRPKITQSVPLVPVKEKTKKERIYDVIYDTCVKGYRFCDSYYGIPFINLEDIEEIPDGIYVIRFRCEPRYLHDIYFGAVAKEVCAFFGSELRFIHERRTEWGLSYEECVWVLEIKEFPKKTPPIWRLFFMSGEATESKPKPKKCSHERWEEFLQTKYGRSLLSVAETLHYSEQNLDLLRCDTKNKAQKKAVYLKHKRLFDSFLNDEWNKALVDGRNVLDYFKDLIASWIGEDLLVMALNEYGFKACLANADSDRVIKTERRQVTGEPDIKISIGNKVRYLELMDALSPVEKYGQFDLRLSKAKNQFLKKTIFLLHGLYDNKFVLIDFMRDNVTVEYNYPNPHFGNKPCSVVRFTENGIEMRDMALLWESLKDILFNPNPEGAHVLKMVDYQTGVVEVLGEESEDSDSSDGFEDSTDDSCDSDSEIEAVQTEEPPIEEEHTEASEPQKTQTAGVDTVGEVEPEAEPMHDIETEGSIPPVDTKEDEYQEEAPVEEEEEDTGYAYTPEQWEALNEGF